MRIDAELIIQGNGSTIPNGTLISEKGIIVYIGPTLTIPKIYSTYSPIKIAYLMPGMWDCHVHFIGLPDTINKPIFEHFIRDSIGVRVSRGVVHAQRMLNAGFTSVREVGGEGQYVKAVIEEGLANGPNIYYSGPAFSMTGGHCDAHDWPLKSELSSHCFDNKWLVDGVDEVRKGVRTAFRNGASHIKICTSGKMKSKFTTFIHIKKVVW